MQVPYAVGREALISKGLPDWQADGICELFNLIDEGNTAVCQTSEDFQDITGQPPTTLQAWIESVKDGFATEL